MLATKAQAILGEAPAMESAQLPSGHPAIRSSDGPMTRCPDGPVIRWSDDPMTIGSSHQAGIKESDTSASRRTISAFRRTISASRRTDSTTAERGFMLATKARAILGEAPAMESAQLPSGHPAIRSSGHFHAEVLSKTQDDPTTRWPDGPVIRWSDDPMTIGSSHQAGIKESNTSASRRTDSTTAERGFMLAQKARAILGEAPAMESAQLPSGHPTIRSYRHPRGHHGKT